MNSHQRRKARRAQQRWLIKKVEAYMLARARAERIKAEFEPFVEALKTTPLKNTGNV